MGKMGHIQKGGVLGHREGEDINNNNRRKENLRYGEKRTRPIISRGGGERVNLLVSKKGEVYGRKKREKLKSPRKEKEERVLSPPRRKIDIYSIRKGGKGKKALAKKRRGEKRLPSPPKAP